MGVLKSFGVCCSCLSIWAIIQLSLMGYFFHIETPILIHDAEDHHEGDFDKYIEKTKDNFAANAINCWIAAAAYGVTLILSCCCVCFANRKELRELKRSDDDELICKPKEPLMAQEVAATGASVMKAKPSLDAKKAPEKPPTPKARPLAKKKELKAEPLPKKVKK